MVRNATNLEVQAAEDFLQHTPSSANLSDLRKVALVALCVARFKDIARSKLERESHKELVERLEGWVSGIEG